MLSLGGIYPFVCLLSVLLKRLFDFIDTGRLLCVIGFILYSSSLASDTVWEPIFLLLLT